MNQDDREAIIVELKTARSFIEKTLADIERGDYDEAATNMEAARYLLPMAVIEELQLAAGVGA